MIQARRTIGRNTGYHATPHWSRRFLFAAILCTAVELDTFAHEGTPHSWRDLPATWVLEPWVLISMVAAATAYVVGVLRLWRASARGQGVTRKEAASFAGAMFVLAVALVSPLHPMGSVLFSAHMTQHELLMLVAAPLLVLSRPLVPFLWCMSVGLRREIGTLSKSRPVQRVWRAVTAPLSAWAIHAAALWIWHAPVLFEATLHSELIHTLQHVSFLGSALLFWWALFHHRSGLANHGAAVLYLFTTSIHSGVLGALLTFARSLIYPAYSSTTSSWGLTPLEDQQLGGLIMWIPAGVVYIVAALFLFGRWMRESEQRVVLQETQSRLSPGKTALSSEVQ